MHGLMGEIEVNGVKYNNVMAPPGIPLDHSLTNRLQMSLHTLEMIGKFCIIHQ